MVTTRIGPLSDKELPVSSSQGRGRSSIASMLHFRRSKLEKLDEALTSEFAAGFEESESCFTRVTTTAASFLGAEKCLLFIKDSKKRNLYTFIKDRGSNGEKVVKPLHRGITAAMLSETSGYSINKATQARQWLHEVDELPNFTTVSYLAWPIRDPATSKSIGVVEFRNKRNGSNSFDSNDMQLSRVIALQLSHAVIYFKQNEIIDGRTKAINQAYEDNLDLTETIHLPSESENQSSFSPIRSSRTAFAIPSQPQIFSERRTSVTVSDIAWDYNVFSKNEQELTMHAIDIFDDQGLFSRFSIPMTTFVNFIDEIKRGYDSDAPYHNSLHAFDVMHVCYLLITKCGAEKYLESFNILSILVAALAHDLGHDGYNNTFHQQIGSELAMTYNGISVLENYSAAFLFRILRKKENNIFARLNEDDMKKMKARLIEMIMDTDAAHHYNLMNRFQLGLDTKKLSRGLLSSMILHVSDVSNPTRPGPIAREWAYVVQTEFFRQGDKEKELRLKKSPFMDRDDENLPQMQIAFIDAVVQPIFRLMADFMPLIEDHCLKPLHLNKAFWHNMAQRGIVKIDDIKSFLDCHKNDEVFDMAESGYNFGDRSERSDHSMPDDSPIPGIPADAKLKGKPERRVSMIALHDGTYTNEEDPELGHSYYDRTNNIRRMSLKQTMTESGKGACCMVHSGLNKLLDSPAFQAMTFLATIYALFAFDLNLAIGSKATDPVIDYITFTVFAIFVVELILSLVFISGYIQFFFWLDIVATISLFFEIGFFLRITSNMAFANDLALAKAGRAAKAGARAGRIASILRLIRLVKIFKFAKLTLGRTRKKESENNDAEDEIENDLHFSMSIVGRRMTESITKKVIIAVVLMLIMFSFTEGDYTPDARQLQLDSIAEFPDSIVPRLSFFSSHDNIIAFSGVGFDYTDNERIGGLREGEILTFNSTLDPSISASFDVYDDSVSQAWDSVITTAFVSLLLATMGLLFSRDAYKMVIHPIEKMKFTVQQLSENPLLHLEKIKNRNSSESNETDMLEQAITKMAALLRVGFGSAGAEVIAKNLSDMGELNPMIPGVRVNAIFGFCDIRDFTFATEGLQQDVMLFVNKIAEITHRHVVDSGGHPNKNIGDAFLLVWKLKSGKNTNSSGDLQRTLFDSSLKCMQKVIEDVRNVGNLGSFLKEKKSDISPPWASSLRNYNVNVGVGLHKGWAIEGAIGSKVKIDPSYLSPHVNIASRLEAATKRYRVPLLMSDAFFGGLSGSVQSKCRRCDKVSFKGCSDPMVIYHHDTFSLKKLEKRPNNYDNLLKITSWDSETDIENKGLIDDIISKINSQNELVQREVFDALFNTYLDKDWKRCKIYCHLWIEHFPSDPVVNRMIEKLSTENFECPPSWPGFHVFMEK